MTQTIEKIRTPEEVFASHQEAIETLNFEQLGADYAEDAVLLTLDKSFIGREAILTEFFQAVLAQFPDTKISFEQITHEDDLWLLKWTAEASAMTVPVGLGIFVIEDGFIRRQVEWFEIVPKEVQSA